jgi:hypothetical protein
MARPAPAPRTTTKPQPQVGKPGYPTGKPAVNPNSKKGS